MSLKAVYDPSKKSRNLPSTIVGIITIVITLLVGFNVITQEQATTLTGYVQDLMALILSAIAIVSGIWSIFKVEV